VTSSLSHRPRSIGELQGIGTEPGLQIEDKSLSGSERLIPLKVRRETCVHGKLKSERSDGEARQGLGVNELFRPDEWLEKSANPRAKIDAS
jgi:hypothetical protein